MLRGVNRLGGGLGWVARGFCTGGGESREEKIRKLKERVREEERKNIEAEIHDKSVGFSTVGTAAKAWKGRVIMGGVVVGTTWLAWRLWNMFEYEKGVAGQRDIVLNRKVISRFYLASQRTCG